MQVTEKINPGMTVTFANLRADTVEPCPTTTDSLAESFVYDSSTLMSLKPSDLWVNLSPHEPQRILPPSLAQTHIGIDLLTDDVLLKSLTADLLSPHTDQGRSFWEKIWREHLSESEHTSPLNTELRVWITPAPVQMEATDSMIKIIDAPLNILMDQDLRSTQRPSATVSGSDVVSRHIHAYLTSHLSTIVNQADHFHRTKFILNTLIINRWLHRSLSDQNKTLVGITRPPSEAIPQIYDHYLNVFKSHQNQVLEVYNDTTHQFQNIRTVSGGLNLNRVHPADSIAEDDEMESPYHAENKIKIELGITTVPPVVSQLLDRLVSAESLTHDIIREARNLRPDDQAILSKLLITYHPEIITLHQHKLDELIQNSTWSPQDLEQMENISSLFYLMLTEDDIKSYWLKLLGFDNNDYLLIDDGISTMTFNDDSVTEELITLEPQMIAFQNGINKAQHSYESFAQKLTYEGLLSLQKNLRQIKSGSRLIWNRWAKQDPELMPIMSTVPPENIVILYDPIYRQSSSVYRKAFDQLTASNIATFIELSGFRPFDFDIDEDSEDLTALLTLFELHLGQANTAEHTTFDTDHAAIYKNYSRNLRAKYVFNAHHIDTIALLKKIIQRYFPNRRGMLRKFLLAYQDYVYQNGIHISPEQNQTALQDLARYSAIWMENHQPDMLRSLHAQADPNFPMHFIFMPDISVPTVPDQPISQPKKTPGKKKLKYRPLHNSVNTDELDPLQQKSFKRVGNIPRELAPNFETDDPLWQLNQGQWFSEISDHYAQLETDVLHNQLLMTISWHPGSPRVHGLLLQVDRLLTLNKAQRNKIIVINIDQNISHPEPVTRYLQQWTADRERPLMEVNADHFQTIAAALIGMEPLTAAKAMLIRFAFNNIRISSNGQWQYVVDVSDKAFEDLVIRIGATYAQFDPEIPKKLSQFVQKLRGGFLSQLKFETLNDHSSQLTELGHQLLNFRVSELLGTLSQFNHVVILHANFNNSLITPKLYRFSNKIRPMRPLARQPNPHPVMLNKIREQVNSLYSHDFRLEESLTQALADALESHSLRTRHFVHRYHELLFKRGLISDDIYLPLSNNLAHSSWLTNIGESLIELGEDFDEDTTDQEGFAREAGNLLETMHAIPMSVLQDFYQHPSNITAQQIKRDWQRLTQTDVEQLIAVYRELYILQTEILSDYIKELSKRLADLFPDPENLSIPESVIATENLRTDKVIPIFPNEKQTETQRNPSDQKTGGINLSHIDMINTLFESPITEPSSPLKPVWLYHKANEQD
jgi:hypothetical protein